MVGYDPFSDAVMRDPWPFYAELRRDAPVFYLEQYDSWFLSRFEDIWESTRNDLFTTERGVTPEMVLRKAAPPPDPVFSMLDQPRQQAYRRVVAPPYGRAAVARREAEIRALTRELLAPLAARGRFDVYADVAMPLASYVIGDLIGLPRDEVLPMRRQVAAYFAREPGQLGTKPENEEQRLALLARIAEIVSHRTRTGERGGDDHISVLLRSSVEGQPLSIGAIVAAIYTLLVTGAEVVPLAVANTIYYLASHPDQRRQVSEDPGLIPHAFAESLRYDQPTNLLGRFVKQSVELRGRKLESGQGVMFLWASGNRDEAEFDRPEVFDISRRPKRSLSFGHGAHKCIGAHLARLEGRVLLEEILALAADYEIERSGVRRSYSEFLHGYERMPITFEPR